MARLAAEAGAVVSQTVFFGPEKEPLSGVFVTVGTRATNAFKAFADNYDPE